jgi:D-beta-D-heptose 7-phosphate kinase / D-beta-D-heptose 1-phosphate adenosyltransferase
LSIVEASGGITHLKSEAKEVFDVTGSREIVIATLAAAFARGTQLPVTAEIAKIAAGIDVGKTGTRLPCSAELIQKIRRLFKSWHTAISREEFLCD